MCDYYLDYVKALADPIKEVAVTFIEKCSSAAYIGFEPIQKVRMAKAEAKARLILAETDIEVSELQQRAIVRLGREECKKQENIESIIKKAVPLLGETAKPEAIDEDWIFDVLEKCRYFSDDYVQSYWGRILAGEANHTGTFSRHCVFALSVMEKKDLELFEKLCSCRLDGISSPLIYSVEDSFYNDLGITMDSMTFFASLGLVEYLGAVTFGFSFFETKPCFELGYFDKIFQLMKIDGSPFNHISQGVVRFTPTGEKLALLCRKININGFLEELCRYYNANMHHASIKNR